MMKNRALIMTLILVLLAGFIIFSLYYFFFQNSNDSLEPLVNNSPKSLTQEVSQEVDININGESDIVSLRWPSSYTVAWNVPSSGDCQVYGYFGDESRGSYWMKVEKSGRSLISGLPDPKISEISNYLYAVECFLGGNQVGEVAQLQIID